MLSGINKGSFQLHLDRDIECACVFYWITRIWWIQCVDGVEDLKKKKKKWHYVLESIIVGVKCALDKYSFR